MEERKSMGSALVDVFDAGVVLVKSEINAVAKKVGDLAKAKGIGVVLLLAAVGPLVLGLIFLILAAFYGLMAVGLPAWGAALVIALLSFAVTVGIAMLGVSKLSAKVDTEMPRRPVPVEPSQHGESLRAPVAAAPVHNIKVPAAPAPAAAAAGASGPVNSGTASAPASDSYSFSYRDNDLLGEVLGDGHAQPSANRTVYASKPDGEAQLYGSGLNRKLHGDDDLVQSASSNAQASGPGISVSTRPTFQEDMKREGY